MKKMKKTQGKLQFFIFWKIAIFLEFFFIFFIFLSFFYHSSWFFIIFHQFHHWKQKWLKNMIKKWKKTRGKLHFFIFRIFRKLFAPLEAKMIKKWKKMKKWKKLRENCNFSFFGKLQFSSSFVFIFFHFFSFFYHFSSFFIIFHQFHHWKQKW